MSGYRLTRKGKFGLWLMKNSFLWRLAWYRRFCERLLFGGMKKSGSRLDIEVIEVNGFDG